MTATVYFTFLDLETTGLSTATDRIVQLCAVTYTARPAAAFGRHSSRASRSDAFTKLCEYTTFAMPGRPISPGASKVTGLTDAVLREKGAVPLAKALRLFKVYLLRLKARQRARDRHVMVTHNGSMFDIPLLLGNLHACGMAAVLPGVTHTLDTYSFYQSTFDRSREWRSFRLADIYAQDVPLARRQVLAGAPHDAEFDVLMLFEVFLAACDRCPAALLGCVSDKVVAFHQKRLPQSNVFKLPINKPERYGI